MSSTSPDTEDSNKTGIGHLIKTTLAAAIGVQSDKNREKDFSQKSIVPYVIMGVIFTALFVLTLIGIVSLVV